MHYQRHFPPLTNRYIFEPERTPSPVTDHPTNRRIFQPELADLPVQSTASGSTHSIQPSLGRDSGRNDIPREAVRTKFNVVYPQKTKPQTPHSTGDDCRSAVQSLVHDGPSQGLPVIPRPRGTLSKPNGGGYCLKEELGWDDISYKQFQKDVHDLCLKYFDVKVAYHDQDPSAITRYCVAARERYPELSRYASYWPAEDFARMYLKNSAAQARRKERIMDHGFRVTHQDEAPTLL